MRHPLYWIKSLFTSSLQILSKMQDSTASSLVLSSKNTDPKSIGTLRCHWRRSCNGSGTGGILVLLLDQNGNSDMDVNRALT